MTGLPQMPIVARLDLATLTLPESHPASQAGTTTPVYGYCILHPDGPILVDTGVGFGNVIIDELYKPQRTPLDEALRRHGVELTDVVAVINSHLHFDHCGQNPLLYGRPIPVLAQAAEYEAIERDEYYTVAEWALPPVRQRRTIQGDERVAEGVTILATPGHTPGHQSVLVQGGDRRVIIGAQAVWALDELLGEQASVENVEANPDRQMAAVDSIRRIKAFKPHTVYFSHCPPFESTEHG